MKTKWFLAPLLGVSFLGVVAYAQDANSQLEVRGENANPPPAANLAEVTDDEKISKFEAANSPVQAVVIFERRLPEGAIKALLKQAGVEPFSAYMALEGMSGFHGVEASEADASVIDNARSISADQTEKAKSFGRKTLDDLASRESLEKEEVTRFAKHALLIDDQNDAMMQGFRTGKPIIFAVGVVGSAAQVQSLNNRPNVSSLAIGNLIDSGQVAFPRIEPPEEARGKFIRPDINRLAGNGLKSEIARRTGKGNVR